MARALTAAERLADFIGRHGWQVTNALQNQERHMREAAEECWQAAWCPQGPPRETTPGYIDISPAPAGCATLATMFDQAADAAAAALEEWEELGEEELAAW